MKGALYAACGTLFTFFMTSLGAALVFCFRGGVGERAQRACLGFAAGVMSAASVFSLLCPAAEQAAQRGGIPWLTVTVGFALGAAAIGLLDALTLRLRAMRRGTLAETSRRRTLLFAAVTLHNIPEGMAVGLAFALAAQDGGLSLAAASALALGIGVQNLPEGAAISLPLRQSGMSRMRSFTLGVLSGAVEPVFGVLVVLMVSMVRAMMPLLMAFAAGAMMLVVFAEMIPEAARERTGVLCAMAGYVLMMALDLALG